MAKRPTLYEKFADTPGMGDALDALDDLRVALDRVKDPGPPDEPAAGQLPAPPFSEGPRDSLHMLSGYLETALTNIDPLLVSPEFCRLMEAAVRDTEGKVSAQNGQLTPDQYMTFTDFVRQALVVGNTKETGRALHLAARRTQRAVDTLDERSAQLAAETEALTGKSAEASRRIDEVIDEGSARIGELAETWTATLEAIGTEGKRSYEEDRQGLVKAGEDAVRSADLTLEELRRILSIAGDESLSAGYGNRADAEEKSADALRSMAVRYGVASAVAAGLAVVLQVVLILVGESGSNWSLLPAKAAFVAALAAIATYYGRQSANHRRYAQQLRNAQLELHNIGPYLAELDPKERAEVRRELVTTFFGKAVETVDDDAPTTAATTEQFLEFARLLLGSKK